MVAEQPYGSSELVLHRRWHQKTTRQTNSTAISRGQTNRHQTKSVLQSVPPSLFRTLLLVLFLSWQRGGLNRRIQGRPAGRCSGGLSGLPRLRGKVAGVLTPTHPSPNRCIETLHCCRGPGFMPTGRVCGATAGCEATPAGGGVWPPNRATNAQYRTARKSGGPGGGSS